MVVKRTGVAELLVADTAGLAEEFGEGVGEVVGTSSERLVEVRGRIYFSRRLVEVLVGELNEMKQTNKQGEE